VAVEGANGLARVSSAPSGSNWRCRWLAGDRDWSGVSLQQRQALPLIVWRVDFAYEGVKDAEHYAATKAARSRLAADRQARPASWAMALLVVYDNVKAPATSSRASCSIW